MVRKIIGGIVLVIIFFSALTAQAAGPAAYGLGTLTAMALAPDGGRLAVGTTIGVYFYDAATFAPAGFWPTAAPVQALAWTPAGETVLLLTGKYQAQLEARAAATGQELWHRPAGGYPEPGMLAIAPDGRWVAVADGEVISLVDLADGIQQRRLASGASSAWYLGQYTRLAFSPDGRRLAAYRWGAGLQVWDTATWSVEQSRTGATTAWAWGPDSRYLAFTSAWDNSAPLVPVWDLAGRTIAGAVDFGDRDGATGLAFNPAGSTLAVGTATGQVTLWPLAAGRPSAGRAWAGHSGAVTQLAWATDGATLFTAGGNAVRAWDPATGALRRVIDGFSGGFFQVAWSADGARVLALGDRALGAWDTLSRQPVAAGPVVPAARGRGWYGSGATEVLASPDGVVVAVADGQGVTLHDGATLAQRHRLYVGRAVWALAFSPDGQRLASAGAGPYINIWNTATGRAWRDLNIDSSARAVTALAFSADGGTLYALEQRGRVRFWDLETGAVQATATPDPCTGYYCYGYVYDPVIHVGASRVVAEQAGGIVVSDLASGQKLYELSLEYPRSIIVNAPGTRLAAIGRDGVYIWDLASGQAMATLAGHTGLVTDLAFSRAGTELASASEDGTVRVWPVP